MNQTNNSDNIISTERPVHPHNRNLKILIMILSAVLVALILAAVVISGIKKDDPLYGMWKNENAEIFQFNGMGKGSWISDDDLGKFNYEIDGNQLRIDYVSKRLPDCIYVFEFENDSLVLIDQNGGRHIFISAD